MADLANSKTVQKWVFLVRAVVILGFLVGILGILLNPKTSAVLQARMAFIFVFFAVACVMGLLFLQSTAKAEAKLSSQGAYEPDPNWNDVSDFPADWLLVTKYHKRLPGGDYILIDPSKYVTAESRGATIEVSVFSDSPLQEPQLWENEGRWSRVSRRGPALI